MSAFTTDVTDATADVIITFQISTKLDQNEKLIPQHFLRCTFRFAKLHIIKVLIKMLTIRIYKLLQQHQEDEAMLENVAMFPAVKTMLVPLHCWSL